MLNGGFESPDAVELKVIQQGPAAACHSTWGLVASNRQAGTAPGLKSADDVG
jgi:hypothetical protein